MAFWVVDGARQLGDASSFRSPYVVGGKRRVSYSEGSDDGVYKRARLDVGFSNQLYAPGPSYGNSYGYGYGYSYSPEYDHDHAALPHHHQQPQPQPQPPLPADSVAVSNLAFLVIRERSPTPELITSPRFDSGCGPGLNPGLSLGLGPSPGPSPGACAMERTESGLSISSDTTQQSTAGWEEEDDDVLMLGDLEAARLVRDHVAGFRRRYPDSQHDRILKALINPKSREADFPLDNDALRSIFSAANEIFFANRLTGRVAWDWSHPASEQYQSHIVGTTALRRSRMGGYETLIVLSSPILKDTKYNRRLLISTFLHEMIHSYLFVTCGVKARRGGGHTEGFRQVAETIDKWVGRDYLRLRDMEADLERFREDVGVRNDHHGHGHAHRGQNSWNRDGCCQEDRKWNDYSLQEPPRQRHPNHHEWQWHEREGFRARSTHSRGSSYVY